MFLKAKTTRALMAAVLGLAVAGCEYDMLGEPQGRDKGADEDARLASVRMEPTDLNTREASPNDVIAISQPATETVDWLTVRSPAFNHNQPIPDKYYVGESSAGVFPTLEWSEVPKGTKSIAVIVEDPDAAIIRPFIHLILFNLPGDERSTGQLRMSGQQLMGVDQGVIGTNSLSKPGFVSPTPGEQPHQLHFQVFALDTMLDLGSGANKMELINAMRNHVLAKGETVGIIRK